jgi:Fuc2NAc and GlcNAc transferase
VRTLLSIGLLVASGLGSLVLAGWVRRYAVERAILDIPNARSSHSAPTPRGGGLAIVVSALLVAEAAWAIGLVPGRLTAALAGGGALVAAAGWYDDRGGLTARQRLLCHVAAAAWATWWVGGMPELRVGMGTLQLGPWGVILAVTGIVWATNLFNFMDGIDGLAGGEGVTLGAAGAGLLLLGGAPGPAIIAAALATACLGFLYWNWSPARLFMGDVGSGFLGFAFAVLALWSERAGAGSVLLWGVVAMAFVLDATVTLVRRVRRGEALASAHRHHAYQRLVRSGLGHASVTVMVLGLNVLLAALALVFAARGGEPLVAVTLAILLCGAGYLLVERRLPM